MKSLKCPYALYLQDFPYVCCKAQKGHPVLCPKDYSKCNIYDNMKFKGTIVITDPCYLDNGLLQAPIKDWWEKSNYGQDMEQFGFDPYIGESTIIGDWSWYTVNSDTGKIIGKFSADAGMVCVCLLDQVLQFNPKFKEWADDHDWCVTIIENFAGDIEYTVDQNDEFHIIGTGNINFHTRYA